MLLTSNHYMDNLHPNLSVSLVVQHFICSFVSWLFIIYVDQSNLAHDHFWFVHCFVFSFVQDVLILTILFHFHLQVKTKWTPRICLRQHLSPWRHLEDIFDGDPSMTTQHMFNKITELPSKQQHPYKQTKHLTK